MPAPTSPKRYLGHVISHTHWDREWYLTVEQYRFRLVQALDRAGDLLQHDPAWHSFFLDGQTQALVDYLEVRPEQEATVRELIRTGKLRIGPWCTQPDEQMISGEAIIRNLLHGRNDCARFGGGEPVGYLADNFGHTSQMPQILRGFGLDNAVFWRGYDEKHVPQAEVRWRGADGSEVLAILLVRGYANAAGFDPANPAENRTERNLPVVEQVSGTGVVAVTDGIDHALPVATLPAILDALRQKFPELDVRHSTWTEFLADVKARAADLPALEGELVWVPGLASTLSNRLNQKQANMACDSLLCAYAEPLAALAALAGVRYPTGFLAKAWRLFTKNTTHDSIGGAHTDTVARDVEHRFARIAEIGEGVVAGALDGLLQTEAFACEPGRAGRLALYNPSPYPRRGVVECELDLADTAGRDWVFHFCFGPGIALYDGQRCLPVHVLEDRASLRHVYFERVIPKIRNTRTLRLLVEVPELPPLGVRTFELLPGAEKPKQSVLVAEDTDAGNGAPPPVKASLLSPEPGLLRNDRVEVRIHADGRFDLTLLSTGRSWRGLNALIDEQDNGTQYDFNWPKNRQATGPAVGTLTTVLNCELRSVVRVDTILRVFDERPLSGDFAERRIGNSAPTIECPLAIEIGLNRGSAQVEVSVMLDNRGAGHRLRAAFGPVAGGRIRAGTTFDLVERSAAANARRSRGVTQAQMDAQAASAMQGLVAVQGPEGGLALAGRGLYEYKHDPDTDLLCLTLLRSAGMVNFGFDRWGSAEGGYVRGPRRIEYAVCPFAGELAAGDTLHQTEAFLRPVRCRQYPTGAAFTVRGPQLPDVRLRFSAWKRAEVADSLIFRFYSIADAPLRATVPLGRRFAQVWQCRLDETRLAQLGGPADAVTLTVAPRQVVTLELVP